MGSLTLELYRAYFEARRHKRGMNSQLAFEVELERNIAALAEEIASGAYRPGPYACFITDQPVKREIFAAGFRDRVVHHLVFNRLNPLIDPLLINDCYSCRQGKGTHYGIQRLGHFIRSGTENHKKPGWVLKLDIKGYFMSIERARLFKQIEDIHSRARASGPGEQASDLEKTAFELARLIIFHDPVKDCVIKGRRGDWAGLPRSKSLFYAPPGRGLPIGNLTSQLFANFYLNGLDHFIKRFLGVRYYGRYVDDLVFVHQDKNFLLTVIPEVREYLRGQLGLELHEKKTFLQPARNGVPFLGAFLKPYRAYLGKRAKNGWHKRIRLINQQIAAVDNKNSAQRAFLPKDLKAHIQALNSYHGLAGHYAASRLVRRMTGMIDIRFWNLAYITKKTIQPRQ